MKALFFVLAIFVVLKTNAQDYLINFTGTKISVDVVQVQNLTTGDSLILKGSDILNLKGASLTTGINDNHIKSGMIIYPNPMTESSTIEINPPSAGDAIISVFDISGRQIAQIKSSFNNSTQKFQLTGYLKGLFIVNVKGSNYQMSGKLICNSSTGTINIEKISNDQTVATKELGVSKGLEDNGIIKMSYTAGDRLKFTASSGNYGNILTDIPDETKTIVFDLIPVIDEDANNYHTVAIGDQTWMEENLKTTKYNDGSNISTRWDSISAYSWYDNSKATFKDPYGALYNGFAVGTGKLCPTGWHVATSDEWISLSDYLTVNGFGYKGVSNNIAKSLSSKTGWNVPTLIPYHGGYLPMPTGAVGKNPQDNNSSGFNGFAAGLKDSNGLFSGIGYQASWYSSTGTSTMWDFNLQNGEYGGSCNLQQGDGYRNVGLSVRCIKGEVKILPVVLTGNPYNITQTTAYVSISIPGVGESFITSRGVCWSEYDNTRGSDYPTIDDYKTVDGSGTVPFISYMTGLKPGTLYYIRGYSINSEGISYGNGETFTTDIADADGNNYNTILLEDMIWTVENLKTTKLNDNTPIPLLSKEWASTAPGYCYYNNDTALLTTYGALYNWYTVNTNKLCPTGWHVASDADWISLTTFLAGDNIAGGRLKEPGTVHWLSPNTGAGSSDAKDFEALPGGMREIDDTFIDITKSGMWWTSTQFDISNAWNRQMNYDASNVIVSHSNKSEGLSVRCIKN
jgi:uncharacterized protein (TIGR02145 family)